MAFDLEYTPATPLDDLVLVQGRTEEMPFNIGGVTATSKDVTMTLTILLPPSHGSLITVDQQVLQSGSIITIPFGASKIPVVYKSYDDDFFSLPEPTIDAEPDVFQYKLEGYDPETGALIGSSGGDEFPALQKIHIQNVNHPHKLLATQGSVQQALSLVSGKPMATITGIEVLDKDKDINVVRVDLEVETGKLGLNEEFRHLADFDSCRVRFQESFQKDSWRCVGNGVHDQRMTFLARPSQVKTILTDLKYVSLTEHKEDGLFISVFDGIGGDCISEYEQTYSSNRIGTMLVRYPSVQNGCYAERAYVRLVGNPELSSDDETGSSNESINMATSLGWAIYIAIGLVVFLLVGIVLRIVFFGFGRRRRGGAAVGFE
jgi:hypothetical protein